MTNKEIEKDLKIIKICKIFQFINGLLVIILSILCLTIKLSFIYPLIIFLINAFINKYYNDLLKKIKK